MWIRIFDETYNDRGHRIITPEGQFLDYAKKRWTKKLTAGVQIRKFLSSRALGLKGNNLYSKYQYY